MQRLESSEHTLNVVVAKVETGGFLEAFVPLLVP